MGTDLVVAGRAQLAGYAGLAGAIRGRARPLAVIAAVDVLAVALAFGALHFTGAMMPSGQLPPLIPPASAATESIAAKTPLVPPAPRIAPVRHELAAAPDAAVMFAQPVAAIDSGFTFTPTSSSTFVAPAPAVADAEPAPGPAPVAVPTPRLRPLERVTQITTPVIDATDGSLDRLLLRDVVPAVGTTFAQTGTVLRQTTTDALGAVGTTVAATAPVTATVQTVAQNITQPVAQVVQGVTGLLR